MSKHKITNMLWICCIVFLSIVPMLVFSTNIRITKYSIPAICLLVFHLLYGFAAYCFRHKGNVLRFNILFFRHFIFNLFESNEDYTFTREYKQQFNRMMMVYFSVVPLYIPCIFLTSNAVMMPLALLVFLVPQILFISIEILGVSNDIKQAKQKKEQQDQERKEQERRESMGKWK